MSTGTLLVGDHIWIIIIPMEQLGQITLTEFFFKNTNSGCHFDFHA